LIVAVFGQFLLKFGLESLLVDIDHLEEILVEDIADLLEEFIDPLLLSLD